MGQDPSKNVNAVEDFLQVTLHSYVIGAAKHIMGIKVGEEPESVTPIEAISKEIVKRFTTLQW